MRQTVVLICVLVVMVLGGCRREDAQQQSFNLLLASDLGLGIHLGDSQELVAEKLGNPYSTQELAEGIEEHYYLNSENTLKDPDTPQLLLTYQDDKLIRLYNRYYPEDESMPLPPQFAEILPGVKLGNRKSDVISPLGPPTNEAMGTEWRFQDEAGGLLVLRAAFTDMPMAVGQELVDTRCSMLYLALSGPVGMSQGEIEDNKIDWRDLGKDPEESN